MRFLLDASLPRSATVLLHQMGHDAADVRDVIAAYGRHSQRAPITRDLDFADIRNYPPADYAGIVVLRHPQNATATQVVKLLEAFGRREDWLAQLSGRLAIVEVGRVRFRPV